MKSLTRWPSYIMRIRSLSGVQRAILIRIYDICREDVIAWISHRRLAEDCGCSRETIRRAIKGLDGTWLIVHSRQLEGTTNRYRPSARLMRYLHNQDARDDAPKGKEPARPVPVK